MESDFYQRQKQLAASFWKAYFAKFQRRVEDDEPSQTLPAPLPPPDNTARSPHTPPQPGHACARPHAAQRLD